LVGKAVRGRNRGHRKRTRPIKASQPRRPPNNLRPSPPLAPVQNASPATSPVFPFFFCFAAGGGGRSRGTALLLVPFSIFGNRRCIFVCGGFRGVPLCVGGRLESNLSRGCLGILSRWFDGSNRSRLICGESSPANVSPSAGLP
jgi:hypothetical protein